MSGHGTDAHADAFTHLRPLLFTIAYEILGSATEADDVLQDSYLRWAQVDLTGVADIKSYLAQIVSRQALNTLRANQRRREEYIGPWLPEPVRIDESDASADVVLAESVSMAMLVVLETLTPEERAVFVMREVFGFEYGEIASTVSKSEAAVRQMAHRARQHVQARRKRFTPTGKHTEEVTNRFLLAATSGDVEALMELLAPDVVWTTDSDGKASAARRPVHGASKVARLAAGLARAAGTFPDARMELAVYNSAPTVLIYLADRLEVTMTFEVVDAKVTHVYAMRNPDKLEAAQVTHRLSR